MTETFSYFFAFLFMWHPSTSTYVRKFCQLFLETILIFCLRSSYLNAPHYFAPHHRYSAKEASVSRSSKIATCCNLTWSISHWSQTMAMSIYLQVLLCFLRAILFSFENNLLKSFTVTTSVNTPIPKQRSLKSQNPAMQVHVSVFQQ